MKGGNGFMFNKPVVLKIVKVAVTVIGVGVTLATNYFADKELDDKVSKKVAEALAKANEES